MHKWKEFKRLWVEELDTKRKVNSNKGSSEREVKSKAGQEKRLRLSPSAPRGKARMGGKRENLPGIKERGGRTSCLTAFIFLMTRKGIHFSGQIKCQSWDFREKVEV